MENYPSKTAIIEMLNRWRVTYPGNRWPAKNDMGVAVRAWQENLPNWTDAQLGEAIMHYPASKDGGYPPNPGRLRAAWDELQNQQQEVAARTYRERHRPQQAGYQRSDERAAKIRKLVAAAVAQMGSWDGPRQAWVAAVRREWNLKIGSDREQAALCYATKHWATTGNKLSVPPLVAYLREHQADWDRWGSPTRREVAGC